LEVRGAAIFFSGYRNRRFRQGQVDDIVADDPGVPFSFTAGANERDNRFGRGISSPGIGVATGK
jgi:hypothetical protein